MPMQYKAMKAANLGIDGRTVTGIFAVHGNVDDGDGWSTRDRSHPGVFGDFTVDGRRRAVFLWQHRSAEPPIATIDQLFEIPAADLPPAVKLYAPEATGGTAVKRTYLDTPRGDEVLAAIKAGAISEMSYAYDVTRYDIETRDEDAPGLPIRNLYEADLYDISDVNWGMNPATSADGSKGRSLVAHGDSVRAEIAALLTRAHELADRRAKEGRMFSQANIDALKSIADDLDRLGGAMRELIAAAEPKHAIDVRRLWLESQRVLATLNGVPHL